MSQRTAVSLRPSVEPPSLFCEVWQVPTPLRREDLTRFGLFVRSSAAPGLHSELEVRVVLGDALHVTVQAMVVEVVGPGDAGDARGAGYAMLFQHVSEAQGQVLDRILAALQERGAGPRPQRAREAACEPERPSEAVCEEAAPVTKARELPAVARELQAQAESWRNAEPHVVLGVRKGATPEQVEAAFLGLAQRYHPHRFVRHDSKDVTDAATDLFLVIKQAHGRCSVPPREKPRRQKRQRSRAMTRRAGGGT